MPSLGLAMIVKDGAKTLQNCIASVAGVTERMVIADTGSGDGSSQLARDLGRKYLTFLGWMILPRPAMPQCGLSRPTGY